MAIKKIKEIKGRNVEAYWKIVNLDVVTGQVMVAPFEDREAAKNRSNMLEGRTLIEMGFDLEVKNPKKIAYEKLKESKMETVTDEDGNESEVESNWFADAIDVLEE